MRQVIKPLPFKAGDTVIIHGTVQESYGYRDALPICRPRDEVVDATAVVERVDFYDEDDVYPDVKLRLADGGVLFVDVCYLSKKPKKKPLTPQCRTLLRHFQKGHTITQRSALLDFGIAALPRRIADLKEHGHNVKSVMEYNKLTDQRYARYSLVEEAS